jgi:UDP-GlcNAc:undecaprenyl-phosphate GlcNAc-1-phosphate transferase
MEQYIIGGVAGFILTLVLTPLVRHIAIKNNIVDQPGGRRINKQPIPRMGGAAIVIAFWLTILVTAILSPDALNFTGEKLLGIDRNLFGVLLGAIILVTTGVVDDIYNLSPVQKLVAQLVAAACVPLFGIHIQWLAHPLNGPDIQLPLWLDNILIVIWIFSIINVVNWLDGLDGLAAGISTIAALILFFLSIAVFVNQPATALLAIVLFGCCLGFLPYNFNPARIFMGDSGSMFLGYTLAILAIISGGKLATAGLILGVPILDAAWVIIRRMASGQAPWKADRKHLHHRLLDAGLSQRQTVLLYWGFSALFGGIALASQTYGKVLIGVALLFVMLTLGGTLVYLERIKQK